MKKTIGYVLVFAVLMLSNSFEARAQTVKRIQFAKGKTSATVRGNTGQSGVYYDLRVKAGQKMALNLSPASTVGIRVETAGGTEVLLRERQGGYYELYFEKTSDVSIFVGSRGARPATFTLSVKITRLADI